MMLASVPPAPMVPKSRLASRELKSSFAIVQYWMMVSAPNTSTRTYKAP